jgi:hypothetical protein
MKSMTVLFNNVNYHNYHQGVNVIHGINVIQHSKSQNK